MPTIDGERVVADLKRLAEFGHYKTGVHRPTYSPDDVAARHWLAGRLREAGLDPVIDGVGNVIAYDPQAQRRLLIGSHSETQPYGGWLDGALGVIYGLELARAFAADPDCAGFGIEVAAWADEEGHYSSYLGSRSYIGGLTEDEIDRITGRDTGKTLRAALAEAGFAGRARERVEPGRHIGYLEAHIEQGDTLDASGLHLGVVETIVGIRNFRISFTGEQNHAGTTRMVRRRDAGVAMVRLATRIHDRFAEIAGPRTVWTIGRMGLEPNAPSVIPGHAEMQLQFRDPDLGYLDACESALSALVADANRSGPCRVAIEPVARSAPTPMDPGFQASIEAAAEHHAPGLHLRMPSAAGHDAAVLAECMPAGMMFIPSLGGVSHHWSEDTGEDDIVLGARVFADAAFRILQARR
ncbi:MAG TPA: hydantoinase/carbamoylase family amidase [Stellaceae bacterium]|nr:hydantoinase/carbamoylase family amidase [Stellaceae bacterium]